MCELASQAHAAILNEIHGTPVDDDSVEENNYNLDEANRDFEEDYQDQFNDGGFGDFDEGGFISEVQGHDIDDDSEDPDSEDPDSDSGSDSDSTDVSKHHGLESGLDDSMFYSNSDESEHDFDCDLETDEEIPGIHTSFKSLSYYPLLIVEQEQSGSFTERMQLDSQDMEDGRFLKIR
jgi:hypothetical protein